MIDKKDLKYISREDYARDHDVKGMTAEEVNKLVDTHGEESMWNKLLICMFEVGSGGLDNIRGKS